MGRDARRALLVLASEADLFVALRDRLESPHLTVRWSEPDGADREIKECLPWPWAIAGFGGDIPAPAVALFGRHPALCFWLGESADLPAHGVRHARWPAIADDIEQRLSRRVFGFRLAPNRGLESRDGRLILSPELEGLVGAHPSRLRLPGRALLAAGAAISQHRLALKLHRRPGESWLTAVA